MLTLLTLLFSLQAAPGHPPLTVQVTGLRNTNGHVLISVFDTEKGYPSDPKAMRTFVRVPVGSDRTVTHTFTNLPAGNYALSILHDENNDGKMNTNWMGMPTEGYGASNNARGFMGPPKYKDARITLGEQGLRTVIQARYL